MARGGHARTRRGLARTCAALPCRAFDFGSIETNFRAVRSLRSFGLAFDRNRDEMPQAYQRTPKEWIWLAFKSGAAMPLGERQLRNILAN